MDDLLHTYQLPGGRVLVIPDMHQDVRWARGILDQEDGNWDHLVFLGDYWDSWERPPAVADHRETAAFLVEVRDRWPEQVTFLLGNHDMPYVETLNNALVAHIPRTPMSHCPGFSPQGAIEMAPTLGPGFFAPFRLFVEANGFLLSHAGIHPHYWRAGEPGIDNPLDSLEALCDLTLRGLGQVRSSFLESGGARGGSQPVGGITWLDWSLEFVDDPSLPPQIVGHSQSREGARRKGRSWCIDGDRTCWLVIQPDGSLDIRSPQVS